MYTVEVFDNELVAIRNAELRALVRHALESAPAYFWTAPASSTGKHHPPDSNGVGGLVRHTLKGIWFTVKFCEAYDIQHDSSVAAFVLHDWTKFGLEAKMETGRNRPFYKDHARICAKQLSGHYAGWIEHLSIPDSEPLSALWSEMCSSIQTHMGRWGPEPPVTAQQWIVHLADMAASEKHFIAIQFQNDTTSDTQEPVTLPPMRVSQDRIIDVDGISTMNFGKYAKGEKKTVAWVVKNDPGYTKWVLGYHEKPFEPCVIDAFIDALEVVGDNSGLTDVLDSAADRKSEEFWDAF